MKHVIYIPGLGYNFNEDLSMESYAHRMRLALENNNDPKLKYEVKINKVKYGANDKYFSGIATIIEQNGSKFNPIFKIYEFKYGDELIARFKKSNKFVQLMMISWAVISRSGAVVKSWFKTKMNGMSIKQQFQILWMIVLIISTMLLGVLVLLSLLASITEILTHGEKEKVLQNLGINLDKDWFKNLTLGLTSFTSALFLFNNKYRDTFYESTTEFLCANNYLKYGDQHAIIGGKLDLLLQKIAEEEQETDEIAIHAYSFGSVIALDFIYPYGHEPSELIKSRLTSFVSIGCPFDFIRTYYPYFYDDRKNYNLKLCSWINVCSSTDILSSNFRNDNTSMVANVPIVENGLLPQNVLYDIVNSNSLSFIDYIFLIGLKAHAMYWDDETDGQSFMNSIILKL